MSYLMTCQQIEILILLTENTKYALRVANPWVAEAEAEAEADRPTGGWLLEGCIVITP
jgi:hypothetical protein